MTLQMWTLLYFVYKDLFFILRIYINNKIDFFKNKLKY